LRHSGTWIAYPLAVIQKGLKSLWLFGSATQYSQHGDGDEANDSLVLNS
jgi:hypothetical protein